VSAGPNAILFEPETRWYPFLEFAYEKWEDRIARIKRKDESPGSTSSAIAASSHTPGPQDKHEDEEVMSGDAPSALAAVKRIVARRKSLLSKAVPMGLCFANNKAMMGGKAVYAGRIRRRVRSAISIIVSHGAKLLTADETAATGAKGSTQLGYDLDEVESRRQFPGNKWILRGMDSALLLS